MIKSKKSCVKRIHLVTDDGLYDRKAFYTIKIVFYLSSKIKGLESNNNNNNNNNNKNNNN